MDPALRLHPGQRWLTPVREAEARRFADEFIRRQLSTEPVDEQEAEAWLRQAYAVAGLAPPQRIHWLDGPLPLVAALAPSRVKSSVGTSAWASVMGSVRDSVWVRVRRGIWDSVESSLRASVRDSVWARVRRGVWVSIGRNIWASVRDSVWDSVGKSVWADVEASVGAYYEAAKLAYYAFFDTYLAANDLAYLAAFNALVSGSWLGQEDVLLVRRPSVLCRDAEGRLHSATGKCVEYPDGWGFYAWHGVRVPEQIILAPERLSREDFQSEQKEDVRRVILERLGERCVRAVGGRVIDSSPRGTLYEVVLPGDPERMGRYIQVQDATSLRQHVRRVPLTIQTAAEAAPYVAQSFELSLEDEDVDLAEEP